MILLSTPNEIRHHIAAVEQTRKITGAMEMVASNRMRRVMNHIEQNNKYFDYVQKTMKQILSSDENISHEYLRERPGNNTTYIVISGDKGLCGSYNSAVLELALSRYQESPENTLITVGNTAEDFFLRRGIIPEITLLGIAQDPTLARTRVFSREVMRIYDEELTDEVRVIYTSFYGESKNTPVERRLLPLMLQDYDDITDVPVLYDIEYHPSKQVVFDMLVPQYVLGILFGVTVQAYASEHYARMNAMRSATLNAKEMMDDLKTRYNMARQSAITNEISEITGAAEILRNGDSTYGKQK